MKRLSLLCLLLLSMNAFAASQSEDWKGRLDDHDVDVGALSGLALVNYQAGLAVLGTASKKIVRHGFVPEITDSVSLELEAGPVFVASTAVFNYSVHMRWDFQKDDEWTFYALGGAGGNITPESLGSQFQLYPRIGLGALWEINPMIRLRAEVSHELMAIGALFPL